MRKTAYIAFQKLLNNVR